MHEARIAEKIILEAEKQGSVAAISIEVGELAEITREELQGALEQRTGWQVKVMEKKSRIRCKCGHEGTAHIVDRGHGYCLFNCPGCGEKPNVLEGGDIKITGIECVSQSQEK